MMDRVIQWLQTASWLEVSLVLLLENLVIFALVILIGNWLVRRYSFRPVATPPEPVTRAEVTVALANVLLNTAVTIAGWQLWLHGVIRFRTDTGVGVVIDTLVLLLLMDLLMYCLHRLAHVRPIYSLAHQFHHRYEKVRPLTLFALNPVENIGFGLLWLAVICVYPASWAGMSAYLILNVVFGAVGHLGVEPVPSALGQKPVMRYIAGSSFHAQHHQDVGYNYGFYTLIWDRLFGTLRPDYNQSYGRMPEKAQ
jgi:sterol desaturase/sphingolipid hydroxylase (fatty acid hydroxylase superfamily)